MPPKRGPGGGSGPEVEPSSCPPAHSALLSDTCIDLTGRYGHRLAALLSTAAPSTSLCLQTKAGQRRLHLTRGLHTTPTPPPPQTPLHQSHCHCTAGRSHQGALQDSCLPPSADPSQTCRQFSQSWGDEEAKSSRR